MGIEPTSVAWEATALPLSYARVAWAEFMRRQALGAMRGVHDKGRLLGPCRRQALALRVQRYGQKLPLKFTNTVASRALRWAVVVLRPMLLCRPQMPVRAPSTTVA